MDKRKELTTFRVGDFSLIDQYRWILATMEESEAREEG